MATGAPTASVRSASAAASIPSAASRSGDTRACEKYRAAPATSSSTTITTPAILSKRFNRLSSGEPASPGASVFRPPAPDTLNLGARALRRRARRTTGSQSRDTSFMKFGISLITRGSLATPETIVGVHPAGGPPRLPLGHHLRSHRRTPGDDPQLSLSPAGALPGGGRPRLLRAARDPLVPRRRDRADPASGPACSS